MFVQGVKAYFEQTKQKFDIKETCCTSLELQEALESVDFDLLLLELNIPDQDGMEVIKMIKGDYPNIYVIVLSSYTETKLVRQAMLNGADGYVSKQSTFNELLYAIQEIQEGHTYVGDGLRTSPGVKTKPVPSHRLRRSTYDDVFTLKQKLTKREIEILELITQGKNNKKIGRELYISDQTVGVHRKNIMKKLGMNSTVSLIKFALENHLV